MKTLSILVVLIIIVALNTCVGQTPMRNQTQADSQATLIKKLNTKLKYGTNKDFRNLKSQYNYLNRKYHFKYRTFDKAVEAFKKALGWNVEPSAISFYVPGKVPQEDGKPYFILDATTSYGKSSTKKDYCQKGWFSLTDDNIKFWEDYCGPIN